MKKRTRPFNQKSQELARSIRFDIPDVPFGVGHCVYKLFYGDHYLIHTGKTLAGSLYFLQNGYAYHVGYKQSEADDRQNKTFIKFYRYLQSHPGLSFRLELILESNSPYEVLKRAQMELDAAIHDKKCLNNNLNPYIPKWRPKIKMYGDWISRAHLMNYRKYLKNH